MQQDKMEMCHRCTSDASYFIKNENVEIHYCYGCGFTSINQEANENLLPELYRDLKFIDKEDTQLVYYPSSTNIAEKGMVFAEGTSTKDWKWAAVLAVKIPENELSKFPKDQTYKMDMTTIQYFDERDFLEALDYIGYFESQNP